MEPIRITKILKIGNSIGVVVPKHVFGSIGLQRGDQVMLSITEDNILCIKKLNIKTISW